MDIDGYSSRTIIFSNCRDRPTAAMSTNTAANQSAAPQAMTSQTNRRHMVAVTQFILITVVYVIAFLSLNLHRHGVIPVRFIFLLYYINHLSNFFIYLAVNKEFRNEAKKLVTTMWDTMCRST